MFRRWVLTLAVLPAAAGLALMQPVAGTAGHPPGPTVGANVLVDLDHNLAFPRNKQNEPASTRDPLTGVLVAGANEEIGQPPCPGTTAPLASPCPFKAGVPTSGFYRSLDNGQTWSGGYLPGFANIGHTSGGDPTLDYGPRLCAGGQFSFSCGAAIYYGSLVDPFPERGAELGSVSRSFDDGATWADPVIATSTSQSGKFVDHEWVAVDNKNQSSPHFGRVYLNWAVFCNFCSGNGSVKLFVAHSDDEGRSWSPAVQISSADQNLAQGFRETGQMAVASDGTVEAFWTEDEDSKLGIPSLQVVATSKDGGDTFTAPITISPVTDYPLTGTPFDVVDLFNRVPGMSARVDCFPHPASDPSSPRVYVVWCDFSNDHGVVKAAVSADGLTWTLLGTIADVPLRNAFFPEASVAPDGRVSLTFDALTQPPAGTFIWQTGQQVYDNYYAETGPGGGSFGPPIRVSLASSNPDGSSYNNLKEQFLGDYIGIVSGPTSAFLVWTDSRNADQCAAVGDYRQAVYAGSKTAVAPNPDLACSTDFGNTDTVEATVSY